MSMKIEAIYRYPVKGMSPEALDQVTVERGLGLPLDRILAFALGSGGFNPAAPGHLPKTNFLMLMRHARLAEVTSTYDDSGILRLSSDRAGKVAGDVARPGERDALTRYVSDFMGDDIANDRPLSLVEAPGHMFSDVAEKCLSLVNLESIRALEKALGRRLDPLRFRANIYFSGAPAWAEMQWPGRILKIGGVRLKGFKITRRCAATDVEPATGRRQGNIPKSLMRAFGHADMGLYARVRAGGRLAVDKQMELL